MKSWEPEQSFKKADFKGARAEDPARKKPDQNGPSQLEPAAKPVIQELETDQGKIRLQAWQPGTQFEKADIPSRSSSVASGSQHVSKLSNTIEVSGAPQARDSRIRSTQSVHPETSIPETRKATQSTKSHVKKLRPSPPQTPREARKNELQDSHLPPGWNPQSINRSEKQNVVRSSKSQAASGVESGLTAGPVDQAVYAQQILRELVLARRESVRHILRNWYWEKPGQSIAKMSHLPPTDRIAVVLRAMGKEVLQILFQSMSPKERAQLVEILRKPYTVPAAQATQLCNEFMEMIQNDS